MRVSKRHDVTEGREENGFRCAFASKIDVKIDICQMQKCQRLILGRKNEIKLNCAQKER